MREDTNFKGSDSSCPSIYFLFYDCRLRMHAVVQGVGCDMFRRNRITQEHRQRIVQAFENEVVFVVLFVAGSYTW